MVLMHETTQIPGPIEIVGPKYSGGATFAAGLGWSLFFLVPVLYLAAWQEAAGGPNDSATPIFVITALCAVISVASAATGAYRGSDAIRKTCQVLLTVQLLPLVTIFGGFR